MEHRFEIREGPPCNLARKLIAEGKADRNDRLVILRDGKPVLRGGVGWYADRLISETPMRASLCQMETASRCAATREAKSASQAIPLPSEPESGFTRGGH